MPKQRQDTQPYDHRQAARVQQHEERERRRREQAAVEEMAESEAGAEPPRETLSHEIGRRFGGSQGAGIPPPPDSRAGGVPVCVTPGDPHANV